MSKERQVLQISQQLSGRWTIPILLALESSGGRFTPLQNRLDITPARLSDNLKQLSELGLIHHLTPQERRHPLLPEYKLTEAGLMYREVAHAIRSSEDAIGRGMLSEKAWNMPILIALGYEYERFQDIKRALQPVTPRALSTRLEELHGRQLIEKHITDQPRPAFQYQLSGHTIRPIRTMTEDIGSLLA